MAHRPEPLATNASATRDVAVGARSAIPLSAVRAMAFRALLFVARHLRWFTLATLIVVVAAVGGTFSYRWWKKAHRPPHPPSQAALTWHAHAPPPAPVFVPSGAPGRFVESVEARTFQRGCLHAHSLASDGEDAPEAVYSWYRDHGFNFVALSDHNVRVDPATYAAIARDDFVMLPAEELTMRDVNRTPVHVNAICSREQLGGGKFSSVVDALRTAIARIAEDGSIALIDHPNFSRALGPDDVFEARGAALLEIWSGLGSVHSEGGKDRPSEEALWDEVLTRGLDIGAVAVDDLHHLKNAADDRSGSSAPARGWVEVFAEHASVGEICDALRARRLIASNGVRLLGLSVHDDVIEVTAKQPAEKAEFIGQGGALLDAQAVPAGGSANTYRLRGGERYVRARISNADGKRAWTQAYRVVER